jgi:hypothetical protein
MAYHPKRHSCQKLVPPLTFSIALEVAIFPRVPAKPLAEGGYSLTNVGTHAEKFS